MKAIYKKSTVDVLIPNGNVTFFATDIKNISYCLSLQISYKLKDMNACLFYYDILKKQKSIRACVQKFNSICKALDL